METMKFKIRHAQTQQTRCHGLVCYGRRIIVPKRSIIGIYTALAVAIPIIVPLPLVILLQKMIPNQVRI